MKLELVVDCEDDLAAQMRSASSHHLVRGARLGERQYATDGYRQLLPLEHSRDFRQLGVVDVDDEKIRADAILAGKLLVRANDR